MTLTDTQLAAALEAVAGELARARFALAGARRDELLALRDRVRDDLCNHAARARDIDAPLLAVLGGVTGAGKSTVANTLAGRAVVETGVIRPTTTQPTVLCHPVDTAWFTGPRVLTAISRQVVRPEEVAEAPSAPGALRVVPLDELHAGLAFLDAPDIDSVSTANRDLADLLLDAADLWLWFTTVGKYADEESMRYLRRAQRRGTALVVVLTQVRDADRSVVTGDFMRKLAGAGVEAAELVVVPWVDGLGAGRLPDAAIGDLWRWLERLADPDARRLQRRQTLDGAVAALHDEMAPLTRGVRDELDSAQRLLAVVTRVYDRSVEAFAQTIDDGLPLRGEILGRWTDYVGSSRMLELTGRLTTQARRWVEDLLRGGANAQERRLEREVRVEVAATLTETTVRLADLASTDIVDAWEEIPGGRQFGDNGLRGHSPDLPERAADAVAAWQSAVVDLVVERGVQRRSRARWMSTAINAVATGAIVVALGSTGGLTGAEAGIATAAGAANQALLVTVLGERNVRWLISEARKDLVRRFSEVLEPERRRMAGAVAEAAPDPDLADDIEAAVAGVRS